MLRPTANVSSARDKDRAGYDHLTLGLLELEPASSNNQSHIGTLDASSSSHPHFTSFIIHYTFQYYRTAMMPLLGSHVEDVILWKFRVKTKRYLNCRLLLRMMEFFLKLSTQSLCGGIGLALTGSAGCIVEHNMLSNMVACQCTEPSTTNQLTSCPTLCWISSTKHNN